VSADAIFSRLQSNNSARISARVSLAPLYKNLARFWERLRPGGVYQVRFDAKGSLELGRDEGTWMNFAQLSGGEKAVLLVLARVLICAMFSNIDFLMIDEPSEHLDIRSRRHAWEKTLEAAGILHFWLYNLRHSYASRLSAAGVSDLFVAQMIGHNSPGILQKYSKAIDEYRREAVRRLERMRAEHALQRQESAKSPPEISKSSRESDTPTHQNYYSFTTVRRFSHGKRPWRRCNPSS